MNAALGIVIFLGILAFGVAQLAVGFLGIEHHLGSLWAWVALAAAVFFRFTLPISVGVFFGATSVLGWHWILALAFAAPGLLIMVPGIFAAILGLVKDRRTGSGEA